MRIILLLRASLGTLFSHGISIFPRENELISLGKLKIPWENVVPKLALKNIRWPMEFSVDPLV
jgi:hypothetical protein